MRKKTYILNKVCKYLLMVISDWTNFLIMLLLLCKMSDLSRTISLPKKHLLHKMLAGKSEKEEKNKPQFSTIQFKGRQSFDLFPFS